MEQPPKVYKPLNPLTFTSSDPSQPPDEYLLFQLSPLKKQALLSRTFDLRLPFASTTTLFLLGLFHKSASKPLQVAYSALMTLGVGVLYMGISREIEAMYTVDQVALHASGKAIRFSNIRDGVNFVHFFREEMAFIRDQDVKRGYLTYKYPSGPQYVFVATNDQQRVRGQPMIIDMGNAEYVDKEMIKALQEGASEVDTGVKVEL